MTTITAAQPHTPADTASATDANPGRGRVRRFRLLAVGAAVLGNSAIYLGGRALGTDFVLTDPGNPVPHPLIVAEIAVITAVFGLLGWGTLALLERFTRHARAIWTGLATVVLVLSFVPLGIELATTDTKILLGVMHVVVAAALVPMLRHTPVRR
ncbi:DUF6069 family protein [Plantactinospora endophytica]|uniref:DUF4383 domain-containing protein n=1 Tax=Plantactinospora endophytica TaxID=673535 RepID=A0ABQ4DYK5_9ACTN|nr:DUF6069 family protein [Plantactinospora endophytica]GIG87530.1 hypothetical protein Pen02_24660 [Plantactinospora endophytica]